MKEHKREGRQETGGVALGTLYIKEGSSMSLLEDARNIQRKDPAARNVLEVILLYPGFHILVYHRVAHWLYEHKHFFLARWVSQHGRHKTGIEIHPGAKIG